MFGGSLGVILGVIGLPWVAKVVLWLPWLALAWTVAMVQWTASLPFASLTIAGYGPTALVLTYAVIFGLRWRRTLQRAGERLFGWLRRDWVARLAAPGVASALTVTTALVWAGALTQPDGRLHVWFLDIGQGDGILLQTPSGRQVLIDGGASPQALFAELGAVMPFWDRSLDLVVLTHPDGDHMIAQVETPTRFQLAAAWNTADGQAHPDAAAWRTQLAAGKAAVQVQHSGGWADLGDGVALWVLSPPSAGYTGDDADNDNSLVTKLVYGDFSVLLTGDAGTPVERNLVADATLLRSVVLKAGHHGSRSGSSEVFVQAVEPPVVVIQVGKDNDYGHPHAEVLARLEGRLVLRNDEDGRVHVESDGRQMWIATER